MGVDCKHFAIGAFFHVLRELLSIDEILSEWVYWKKRKEFFWKKLRVLLRLRGKYADKFLKYCAEFETKRRLET